MTSFANRKIVATKHALAVVASHATLRLSRGVMIERFGRCHLSALRHSRAHLMTFVAGSLLMLQMTKTHFECLRQFRRP